MANVNQGTAGTYTYTAPAGVTSVKVECWGAGGGGSGGTHRMGGGGGEYATETIAVTPGNAYSYTVGAAGTAGGSTNGMGVAGGNTIFNAAITDPSFESGITGWTISGATLSWGGTNGNYPGPAHTGSGTLNITNVTGSTVAGVATKSPESAASPGQSWHSEIWLAAYTGGDGTSYKLGIEWRNSSHSVLSTSWTSTQDLSTGQLWVQFTLDATAPASTAYAVLVIYGNIAGGGQIQADDAILKLPAVQFAIAYGGYGFKAPSGYGGYCSTATTHYRGGNGSASGGGGGSGGTGQHGNDATTSSGATAVTNGGPGGNGGSPGTAPSSGPGGGGGGGASTAASGAGYAGQLKITELISVTVAGAVAAVSVSASAGTVTTSAGVSGTVAAASSAAPAGVVRIDQTITCSAVIGQASIPGPGVELGTEIAAALLGAVASVPGPDVSAGLSISADLVYGFTDVPGATLSTGPGPDSITAQTSLPAPDIAFGWEIQASTLPTAAAIPYTGILAGDTLTLATIMLECAIPAPGLDVAPTAPELLVQTETPSHDVSAGAEAGPEALTGQCAFPAGTVSAAANAAPPLLTAATAIPELLIIAQLNVALAPASVSGTASLPAATIGESQQVAAFVIDGQAIMPAPGLHVASAIAPQELTGYAIMPAPRMPVMIMVRLTGAYYDVNGQPLTGRLKFSPTEHIAFPEGRTIYETVPVAVSLDSNGAFSVNLLANDNTVEARLIADTQMTFTGTWAATTNDISAHNWNATAHSSRSGIARMTMTAGAAQIWGQAGPVNGKFTIQIDGEDAATADTYAVKAQWVKLADVTFPYGEHELAIVVTGAKNDEATDSLVVIDSVVGHKLWWYWIDSNIGGKRHQMRYDLSGAVNPIDISHLTPY